jgi:hypothetical protein
MSASPGKSRASVTTSESPAKLHLSLRLAWFPKTSGPRGSGGVVQNLLKAGAGITGFQRALKWRRSKQ